MLIKIPIVVNEDNSWYVCAHSDWSNNTNLQESRGNISGDFLRVFWIEVNIPDPPENLLHGKVL